MVLGAVASGAGSASEPPLHIIELVVNEGAPQTLLVWGDPGVETLLGEADWMSLRLVAPAFGLRDCGPARCARLEDVPGLAIRFEAAAQRLVVSVPADQFLSSRITSSRTLVAPPDVSPGLLLNYDLSASYAEADTRAAGLFELGVFNAGGRWSTGFIAQNQPDADGLVRLDSAWRKEWPEARSALTIGDSIVESGGGATPLRMAGISWGTDFALQPDYLTSPLLAASGTAALPSVVDIYVNQRRVASESVPAGPFVIEDLRPIMGAGEMSVVVRDLLGRETVVTQSFYAPPRLLRAGISSHSLAIGTLREDYGIQSFGYGDLLASGHWRRGLSDLVTAGVGVTATGEHGAGGGAEIDLAAGQLGNLRLQTAVSSSDLGAGYSYGVTAERRGLRVNTVATFQQQDAVYRAPGLSQSRPEAGGEDVEPTRPHDGRFRQRLLLSAGVRLGRAGSIALSGLRQTQVDQEAVLQAVTASYSIATPAIGHLSASLSMSQGFQDDWRVQLGWHRSLGDRRSTSVTQTRTRQGDEQATINLRRSLPRGSGFGYAVSAQDDGDFGVGLAAQHGQGRWLLEGARRDGRTGARAGFSGSALYLDGWHLSRRVNGGFAVLDFDGLAGVTVYADNQPVAVTNQQGRALLPELRPYEANRISIEPRELPVGVQIDSPRMIVTPSAGAGVNLSFPVRQSAQVTGRRGRRARHAGATGGFRWALLLR